MALLTFRSCVTTLGVARSLNGGEVTWWLRSQVIEGGDKVRSLKAVRSLKGGEVTQGQ